MKKSISIFLAIILVLLQLPVNVLAEDMPALIVSSGTNYSAEAGESLKISVKLENIGDGYADRVSATLGNDSSGMVYMDGSSYDSVDYIQPRRSKTLSFNVSIDEMADSKNYSLPLTVTYYSESYGIVGQPDYVPAVKETITENINIRVTSTNKTPELIVQRVDIFPSATVNAGEVISVGFDLSNIGLGEAKDIRVSLDGLSNSGFTLANGVNYKTVEPIENGKKSYVYFELKSSKTLASGSYELGLSLNYKDSKGKAINDKHNFFITVGSNKGQSSSLIIEGLTYPTGSISENKEAQISFTLKNQGKIAAKDVIIEAISSDPSGLVPKSVSIIKLNNLAAGASENVKFNFLSTKDAQTKNYPVEINVKYTDDLGKEEKIEQFVGIFVSSTVKDQNDNKGKPKLIIDKYSFEPQLVKAGENFEMTLSFYNTSSNKSVKNIKIFLTAEAGGANENSSSAFTPVDSSNTFYIDSIGPKGKVEKTITMFTIPDAIAKTHTITANFEYEDNEGNPLEDKELIGVPVVQQSKLDTTEISYFPDTSVGQGTPVSLEFYNTGKVPLYNLMVKLEGNFQMEGGSYYVGNFASGSSDYFEGTVIPNEPGETTGAVVFTYEDSTGQTQEVRKEFTLNVMEMPPMEEFPGEGFPGGEFPMEESSTGIKAILKSPWLWAGLVIVALSIGGFIIYKKKKKIKEEAFDE